jgi:hypothetical protein
VRKGMESWRTEGRRRKWREMAGRKRKRKQERAGSFGCTGSWWWNESVLVRVLCDFQVMGNRARLFHPHETISLSLFINMVQNLSFCWVSILFNAHETLKTPYWNWP